MLKFVLFAKKNNNNIKKIYFKIFNSSVLNTSRRLYYTQLTLKTSIVDFFKVF